MRVGIYLIYKTQAKILNNIHEFGVTMTNQMLSASFQTSIEAKNKPKELDLFIQLIPLGLINNQDTLYRLVLIQRERKLQLMVTNDI